MKQSNGRNGGRVSASDGSVGMADGLGIARAFGYVRVSTDDQTVDLQTDALRRVGVTETFSDEGVSGTVSAAERPGFAALLATARRGDTISVYALSRLGRSMVDVMGTLADLESRGIAVRSLTEPFDTTTPMGRAFAGMLAVFSQLERDLIAERTRAGMLAAKSRGRHIGRPRRDDAAARALLAGGATVAQVVAATGMPVTTVRRIRNRT